MRLNRKLILGAAAMLTAATAAFGGGQNASPEEKAVKARQAHMQLYGFSLGILGAMAKGEMPYDQQLAQSTANDFAMLTKVIGFAYWPPGTTSDDMENSRALAAAWENIDDVIAKSQALAQAADAMAAAAGSVEGIQGAIGAVGGACGSCHKAYRAPNS